MQGEERGQDGEGRRLVRVLLRGKVQGVGFRLWVEREALVRGVEGWVRNRFNGDVEAVFGGDPDAVASMVEICARGPHQARVNGVEVTDAAESELDKRTPGTAFDLLPDA